MNDNRNEMIKISVKLGVVENCDATKPATQTNSNSQFIALDNQVVNKSAHSQLVHAYDLKSLEKMRTIAWWWW